MSLDSSLSRSTVPHSLSPTNGKNSRRRKVPNLQTDLKRLTQECETLRQMVAASDVQMEELRQHTDEFIAIAAHDLKAPLTAVLGYAQYASRLLDEPTPDIEKAVHMLAVAHCKGGMMAQLVEELLDAARCQIGAFSVQPTPGDMAENVAVVLSRLSPDERGRIDPVEPPAPVVGQWDQRRIEQVLANLIGNALKYSASTSRVTAAFARDESGIHVAISDQGIGIARQDLVPIFERFHRAAPAEASSRTGTGLGLYICLCIVQAHGGTMWAESTGESLGATFRFTLPDQVPLGRL